MATILFVVVRLLFEGGIYFVGKLADSNEVLVDYAYISTHYSILLLIFNAPIILKYTNWISYIRMHIKIAIIRMWLQLGSR